MRAEISKAGLVRRIAAWVLDAMLLSMIAVFAFVGVATVMDQEGHLAVYQNACQKYIEEYNVPNIQTQEEYDQLTEEEKAQYELVLEQANQALSEDAEAMEAYYMYLQIPVIGISLGVLVAVLITEFAVPLLLKNGQTLGKKAFSIGVVRNDGVKASTMQLLIRALLGKYTIEIMLPIFVWMMLGINIVSIIVLVGFAILELVVCIFSKTNGFIHDLMAGTVAVDLNTQRVFATTDDLINHVKRIQADRAARQDY